VKELSLQELLQVAGGLPDQAALDELSYKADEPAPCPPPPYNPKESS
jgi:hypothetical protein